jgi:hypothetical protein
MDYDSYTKRVQLGDPVEPDDLGVRLTSTASPNQGDMAKCLSGGIDLQAGSSGEVESIVQGTESIPDSEAIEPQMSPADCIFEPADIEDGEDKKLVDLAEKLQQQMPTLEQDITALSLSDCQPLCQAELRNCMLVKAPTERRQHALQLEYEDLKPQASEQQEPKDNVKHSSNLLEYEDLELQILNPSQHTSDDLVSQASSTFTAQELGSQVSSAAEDTGNMEKYTSFTSPPPDSGDLNQPQASGTLIEVPSIDLGSGERMENETDIGYQSQTLEGPSTMGWEMKMASSEVKDEPVIPSSPGSSPSHLDFESRFESGNLRKAIQVMIVCQFTTEHFVSPV